MDKKGNLVGISQMVGKGGYEWIASKIEKHNQPNEEAYISIAGLDVDWLSQPLNERLQRFSIPIAPVPTPDEFKSITDL